MRFNAGPKGIASASMGGRGARISHAPRGSRSSTSNPGNGRGYSSHSGARPTRLRARDIGKGLLIGSAMSAAIVLFCCVGSTVVGALRPASGPAAGVAPPDQAAADAASSEAQRLFFADKCPEASPESKAYWCDRIISWEAYGRQMKIITTLEAPDEQDSAALAICNEVTSFWLFPPVRRPELPVTDILILSPSGQTLSSHSGTHGAC